mmetsp:Transcript_16035/g.37216  ORF Transcript_16035/g.37216 Transcript_16035/m.37216 type:complete len:325 (+) Transcript_16035:220-1194(+)
MPQKSSTHLCLASSIDIPRRSCASLSSSAFLRSWSAFANFSASKSRLRASWRILRRLTAPPAFSAARASRSATCFACSLSRRSSCLASRSAAWDRQSASWTETQLDRSADRFIDSLSLLRTAALRSSLTACSCHAAISLATSRGSDGALPNVTDAAAGVNGTPDCADHSSSKKDFPPRCLAPISASLRSSTLKVDRSASIARSRASRSSHRFCCASHLTENSNAANESAAFACALSALALSSADAFAIRFRSRLFPRARKLRSRAMSRSLVRTSLTLRRSASAAHQRPLARISSAPSSSAALRSLNCLSPVAPGPVAPCIVTNW